MKKTIIFIVALFILALGLWAIKNFWSRGGSAIEEPVIKSSPLDSTYSIEGKAVTLVNGKSSMEIAPGSASKIETTVFDEPIYGDMDNDGVDDALILLTQNSGGSGVFYYAIVALKKGDTYQGLNAVLLGDRIAPQTKSITSLIATVNYADRKKDEPMTAQPSIGVSKYLIVSNGVFRLATTTDLISDSFTVGISMGETKKVSNLTIKLNKLIGDSRCPVDVVCIQAGSADFSVTFANGTTSETKTVKSTDAPFMFGQYEVSIFNVLPVPKSTDSPLYRNYRVTFQVDVKK